MSSPDVAGVFMKGGNLDIGTYMQGEYHVRMKREIGVMVYQPKDTKSKQQITRN